MPPGPIYLEAQWRAVFPAGSVWLTGILEGKEIKIIILSFFTKNMLCCPLLSPGRFSFIYFFGSFLIIETLLQQVRVASLGGVVERAGADGAEVLQQVTGHQALLTLHPEHQVVVVHL